MFLVARGFSTIDTQYRYPEVLSKQLYNEPGKEEVEAAGPWINDVAVVVVRKSDADQVSRMLNSAQQHGLGMVKLVVEPWVGPADVDQDVGVRLVRRDNRRSGSRNRLRRRTRRE